MRIQIDKLKRRPRQVVIERKAADLPALHELIEQGTVAFKKSINGELEAAWAGQVIEVSGCLATTITLACSRCLSPVTDDLDIPIALSYTYCESLEDVPLAEEIEIESEELGLIPFSGPEIDLLPDLAQEIILALPLQPLCQKTCLGLCPICGCNLNQHCCNCEPPVFHDGLAALKNFKTKQ